MKPLSIFNYNELEESIKFKVKKRILESDDYNVDMQIALKDYLDEEIYDISGGFLENKCINIITDVENFLTEIYQFNDEHDNEMRISLLCAYAWNHLAKITITDFFTNVNIETFLDNPNFNVLIENFRGDIKIWLRGIKKGLHKKEEKFIDDYHSVTCVANYIYKQNLMFTKDGEVVKIETN